MSTLLSIDGRRYARRRATGADPKCWRGLWLVERLDEPRDLVGAFRTAKEADAAAEEDAQRAAVDAWESREIERGLNRDPGLVRSRRFLAEHGPGGRPLHPEHSQAESEVRARRVPGVRCSLGHFGEPCAPWDADDSEACGECCEVMGLMPGGGEAA